MGRKTGIHICRTARYGERQGARDGVEGTVGMKRFLPVLAAALLSRGIFACGDG